MNNLKMIHFLTLQFDYIQKQQQRKKTKRKRTG
jgi:hypothetical protein